MGRVWAHRRRGRARGDEHPRRPARYTNDNSVTSFIPFDTWEPVVEHIRFQVLRLIGLATFPYQLALRRAR